MVVDSKERVKVWNTFFKLAREQAVSLDNNILGKSEVSSYSFKGGTLNKDEILSLQIVSWCILALQAREAHLIDELREQDKITAAEASALHHLGIKEQWDLLPKMAGFNNSIRYDRVPHQVIRELDGLRNNLFHVNYDKLVSVLPKGKKAVSIFNQFVVAMEDMNVILKRHRKPWKRVLAIQVK